MLVPSPPREAVVAIVTVASAVSVADIATTNTSYSVAGAILVQVYAVSDWKSMPHAVTNCSIVIPKLLAH